MFFEILRIILIIKFVPFFLPPPPLRDVGLCSAFHKSDVDVFRTIAADWIGLEEVWLMSIMQDTPSCAA